MIEAIANDFGTTPDAVMGKSRVGSLPEARHWYWWWLVREHGLNNKQAARKVGVDESTIRYALRKCDRMIRKGTAPESLPPLVTSTSHND